MKIINSAAWLIVITLSIIGLSIGESILVPFIIALLIWFIVKKVRDVLDKIPFIYRRIPRWIKTGGSSAMIFLVLIIIVDMLRYNVENIANSYELYKQNISMVGKELDKLLGVDLNVEIHRFFSSGEQDISRYIRLLFNSLSETLGDLLLISFYTIFLFIEEGLFTGKMHLLFKDGKQFEQFNNVMFKIDRMLSRYIALKSATSALTAFLSYIVFLSVGIESPFFWAALIFFFNFIPSVGSIIATILPALFSLLQFGEVLPFAIIAVVVTGIQVLVGNYVEPRWMGNTLNISPLVSILALAFWGAIWGVTGMLLSVPITVALIIIMAQFPSTKSAAILFSEKGRV